MDPYDALHAFYLLTTFYTKRRAAMKTGKDFDNKCTMHNKPSAQDFPACGPGGLGTWQTFPITLRASISELQPTISGALRITDGVWWLHSRIHVVRLMSSFTTDDQIRKFTHTSDKGDHEILGKFLAKNGKLNEEDEEENPFLEFV